MQRGLCGLLMDVGASKEPEFKYIVMQDAARIMQALLAVTKEFNIPS